MPLLLSYARACERLGADGVHKYQEMHRRWVQSQSDATGAASGVLDDAFASVDLGNADVRKWLCDAFSQSGGVSIEVRSMMR